MAIILHRAIGGAHKNTEKTSLTLTADALGSSDKHDLEYIIDSLFKLTDNDPIVLEGREKISFKTPLGATGTIESSSGFNNKQYNFLLNANISYKNLGIVKTYNEQATDGLFYHLTPPDSEPATFGSQERILAISAYESSGDHIRHNLLPNGADPNAIYRETGEVPLQLALKREEKLDLESFGIDKSRSLLHVLLQHGADPLKKNAHGKSAMDTAEELGRGDVVKFFEEYLKEKHSSLQQSPLRNALAQAPSDIADNLGTYQNISGNPGQLSPSAGQGEKAPPTVQV